METGVSYDRQNVHRLGFVSELLGSEDVIKSIRPLLRVSHDSILRLRRIESALIGSRERDPLLADRVLLCRRFLVWADHRRCRHCGLPH